MLRKQIMMTVTATAEYMNGSNLKDKLEFCKTASLPELIEEFSEDEIYSHLSRIKFYIPEYKQLIKEKGELARAIQMKLVTISGLVGEFNTISKKIYDKLKLLPKPDIKKMFETGEGYETIASPESDICHKKGEELNREIKELYLMRCKMEEICEFESMHTHFGPDKLPNFCTEMKFPSPVIIRPGVNRHTKKYSPPLLYLETIGLALQLIVFDNSSLYALDSNEYDILYDQTSDFDNINSVDNKELESNLFITEKLLIRNKIISSDFQGDVNSIDAMDGIKKVKGLNEVHGFLPFGVVIFTTNDTIVNDTETDNKDSTNSEYTYADDDDDDDSKTGLKNNNSSTQTQNDTKHVSSLLQTVYDPNVTYELDPIYANSNATDSDTNAIDSDTNAIDSDTNAIDSDTNAVNSVEDDNVLNRNGVHGNSMNGDLF